MGDDFDDDFDDDDDCRGAAEDVEILSESEGDVWFGVDVSVGVSSIHA